MKLQGVHQKAFLDRYSLKDKKGNPLEKTPEQMWKRVAKAVAGVEKKSVSEAAAAKAKAAKWEKEFYQAMTDFKYVPGGRILAGAGTGYSVTYYNCFVLPSPADSRGGILETLKQMVEIMAHGGGVGINLSSLRPRGARVRKVNGFSSGPCNWAELFSVATKDIIQQGGSRRGALMLMLWDWHPDVEEFITVKQDLTRINGANLSVCVSDKFMDAVSRDLDWELVFPDNTDPEYDDKWDGDLEVWKSFGKKVIVHKKVKARRMWDLISEAAWRSAEPGVVFMERYNKLHNNWYWNRINCVNPCVTGDTLVTTQNGLKKARELKIGDKILTPKGFKPIKKFYNNGVQRIYKVYFSDGGSLSATADHKLRVLRGDGKQEWIKTTNLAKGDRVLKLTSFFGSLDQSWESKEQNHDKNKQEINRQKQISVELGSVNNHSFAFLAKNRLEIQKKIATPVPTSIPDQSIFSTPEIIGGSTARASMTWSMSAVISESFLSSEVDKINISRRGEYLLATVDIIPDNKLSIAFAKVRAVEDTRKYEEVFDVYEPETLTWVTNGYVSLDCGEEGLPPWGVCNLGSINLSALVKSTNIDKKGTFDFRALRKIVRTAVRFQDNIVDMDPYVFEGIAKMQLQGERRIGLGTMGLGDTLIKLHLRYGSDASLKFIDKVYKLIRDEAYKASVELASEKGAFPKFDKEKYPQGKFIHMLPEDLQKGIAAQGIRNSVLLMQAPTGTTALMANTTSGIEPVYEFEFIRKSRLGEHVIRHHLYDEWFKKHEKEKKRPEYFVSANDLVPEDHVKVQAIIQKYVDASISKTVNAPSAHTVDDVKKLYTLAYQLGCKGVTYMREGSRAGVLERKTEKKDRPDAKQDEQKSETKQLPAIIRRPLVMTGVTYQTDTPLGHAFITINSDKDGNPFEVFITIGRSGSDVMAMAEALGRAVSLVLRLQSSVDPREKIRNIIDQLNGIGGGRTVGFGENRVRSLPDAVAKVLAKHFGFKINGKIMDDINKYPNGESKVESSAIKSMQNNNGSPVKTTVLEQLSLPGEAAHTTLFDLCPTCGEASLAYEEGCKKCYSCGYSEC